MMLFLIFCLRFDIEVEINYHFILMKYGYVCTIVGNGIDQFGATAMKCNLAFITGYIKLLCHGNVENLLDTNHLIFSVVAVEGNV